MPPLPPDRHIDRSKIEEYLLHPINGRGDGRMPQPRVCSVWQGDNGAVGVRLITAYPD